MFLLLGLAFIGWAGYSIFTGKGYYKGCPPGGYDRTTDPFGFWAYTILLLAIGSLLVLHSLGVISLPPSRYEIRGWPSLSQASLPSLTTLRMRTTVRRGGQRAGQLASARELAYIQ